MKIKWVTLLLLLMHCTIAVGNDEFFSLYRSGPDIKTMMKSQQNQWLEALANTSDMCHYRETSEGDDYNGYISIGNVVRNDTDSQISAWVKRDVNGVVVTTVSLAILKGCMYLASPSVGVQGAMNTYQVIDEFGNVMEEIIRNGPSGNSVGMAVPPPPAAVFIP